MPRSRIATSVRLAIGPGWVPGFSAGDRNRRSGGHTSGPEYPGKCRVSPQGAGSLVLSRALGVAALSGFGDLKNRPASRLLAQVRRDADPNTGEQAKPGGKLQGEVLHIAVKAQTARPIHGQLRPASRSKKRDRVWIRRLRQHDFGDFIPATIGSPDPYRQKPSRCCFWSRLIWVICLHFFRSSTVSAALTRWTECSQAGNGPREHH